MAHGVPSLMGSVPLMKHSDALFPLYENKWL